MKKIRLFVMVVSLFLLVGCSSDNEIEKEYNVRGLSHITCKRDAEEEDKTTKISIHYDIYYKGEYLKILKSEEVITSENRDLLNQYEAAYKKVFSAYKDLDYYDNTVTRTNDSVKSLTYINYGKIDMEKLFDIEGKEDNVTVSDGKIKVEDWKEFAKKYGTVCEN